MQPRLRCSFERSAQPHSHPVHAAADHPHRHTRRGPQETWRTRGTLQQINQIGARDLAPNQACTAACVLVLSYSQRPSYGSATLTDGAPALCPRPYISTKCVCIFSPMIGGTHYAQSTGQCGWCGNNVCLCATHRLEGWSQTPSAHPWRAVLRFGVHPFASIPTPRLTRSSAQARRPC